MFAKITLSVTAAFIVMVALMVGTPFAGVSEGARPIAITGAHTSISLDRSPSMVVAEDALSSDSGDSDSDSDSSDSSESANDNQNGDSDQMDQQNAGNQQVAPRVLQEPDSDAGEAGQAPALNSYQQQVNPNQ